jgi:hypothetical protein
VHDAKRQVGQLPIKASRTDEGEEPKASSFRSRAGSSPLPYRLTRSAGESCEAPSSASATEIDDAMKIIERPEPPQVTNVVSLAR